jgi:hypothetical protein
MKDRRRRLIRTWLTRVGFAIGRLRGPQPVIVLATTHTPVLTGNLRFIDEELAARRPAPRVVRLTLRRGGGLKRLAPVWTYDTGPLDSALAQIQSNPKPTPRR